MFNSNFNSIVKELNIPIDQNLLNGTSIFDDQVIAVVHTYKGHPRILKIKEKVKKCDLFLFHHVNLGKMLKVLQNIDIPVRNMKESKFTFTKILSEMFDFYIDNNAFPNGL